MSSATSPTLRQRAIEQARAILSKNPVYLDTETTGLNATDEIIEISIVDDSGAILLDSLVKPTRPIPADATLVNGISDADVQSAPTWPILWPQVRAALFGRVVVVYNEQFDVRMMRQSHERYRLPWKERLNTFDLLRLYAEYNGEWDSQRRAYRFISLEKAGQQLGIALPNAHRATADTLLTRAVLHVIAGQPV